MQGAPRDNDNIAEGCLFLWGGRRQGCSIHVSPALCNLSYVVEFKDIAKGTRRGGRIPASVLDLTPNADQATVRGGEAVKVEMTGAPGKPPQTCAELADGAVPAGGGRRVDRPHGVRSEVGDDPIDVRRVPGLNQQRIAQGFGLGRAYLVVGAHDRKEYFQRNISSSKTTRLRLPTRGLADFCPFEDCLEFAMLVIRGKIRRNGAGGLVY